MEVIREQIVERQREYVDDDLLVLSCTLFEVLLNEGHRFADIETKDSWKDKPLTAKWSMELTEDLASEYQELDVEKEIINILAYETNQTLLYKTSIAYIKFKRGVNYGKFNDATQIILGISHE